MNKKDKYILGIGLSILIVYLFIEKMLELNQLSFRGNYYTLFILFIITPAAIFLIWGITKVLEKFNVKKWIVSIVKISYGLIILMMIGYSIKELCTLQEDIVVRNGVSYVANVHPGDKKIQKSHFYYEIVNDYFVKKDFSFIKK
jgi:hypothetical protein